MRRSLHILIAAALAASLTVASAAEARDGHDRAWHGDRGHRRGGGGVGAAVIGGLLGIGIGAALASGGYAAPPPAYYASPPGYYAPPPPAVYYGY